MRHHDRRHRAPPPSGVYSQPRSVTPSASNSMSCLISPSSDVDRPSLRRRVRTVTPPQGLLRAQPGILRVREERTTHGPTAPCVPIPKTHLPSESLTMNTAKEVGACLGLALLALCVLTAGIVAGFTVGGLLSVPVGAIAAAATFQALRRLTGRVVAAAVEP